MLAIVFVAILFIGAVLGLLVDGQLQQRERAFGDALERHPVAAGRVGDRIAPREREDPAGQLADPVGCQVRRLERERARPHQRPVAPRVRGPKLARHDPDPDHVPPRLEETVEETRQVERVLLGEHVDAHTRLRGQTRTAAISAANASRMGTKRKSRRSCRVRPAIAARFT